MQRLLIRLRRLGQVRERLALALGQQPQFEMAHIVKHRPIVRAVVIHKGDGMARFTWFGHGEASFQGLRASPAEPMPNMTKEGVCVVPQRRWTKQRRSWRCGGGGRPQTQGVAWRLSWAVAMRVT